jgi:hypothetical protein
MCITLPHFHSGSPLDDQDLSSIFACLRSAHTLAEGLEDRGSYASYRIASFHCEPCDDSATSTTGGNEKIESYRWKRMFYASHGTL